MFWRPNRWIFLLVVLVSCDTDPPGNVGFTEAIPTIGEYLKTNREEYSKFCEMLETGAMLLPLCGYNPYGEGYTLFLPTDDAVDRFILQNQAYDNFEALLQDTGFIYTLTRYHTLNNQVNTNEFPFGALTDRTLTGQRLTIGFYTEADNPLYKVNNVAPIIQPNMELTNGIIHVISEVLQQVEISGYDWLLLQDGYTILSQALELTGIRDRLSSNLYTVLAEHDSIYFRNGIFQMDDLIDRLSTPGVPYTDPENDLYKFAAFHIMRGEYYLNDLFLGSFNYRTLGNERVTIDVGLDIRINPGVDSFGMVISGSGDTTVIDFISPVLEECNVLTQTGPIHSISELLYTEPFPDPGH